MHALWTNVCAIDNAASSYNSSESVRQKWYRLTRLQVTVTDASERFPFKYIVSTIRFLLVDVAIYHSWTDTLETKSEPVTPYTWLRLKKINTL